MLGFHGKHATARFCQVPVASLNTHSWSFPVSVQMRSTTERWTMRERRKTGGCRASGTRLAKSFGKRYDLFALYLTVTVNFNSVRGERARKKQKRDTIMWRKWEEMWNARETTKEKKRRDSQWKWEKKAQARESEQRKRKTNERKKETETERKRERVTTAAPVSKNHQTVLRNLRSRKGIAQSWWWERARQ